MKNKPIPKIQRRAAGLQIRAALEPRRDSGANLASDIFHAVKENEVAEAKATQQLEEEGERKGALEQAPKTPAESELKKSPQIAQITAGALDASMKQNSLASDASENIQGSALTKFGDGQMRVVSLQPAKPRKINKQPKKTLNIVTEQNEVGKIPVLFERTKAEELYDLLYQLTLGAAEPCETVRVRRSDLMASTNIKTRLTLDLNLKRLEENDLLKIESRPGEQEGNIYTVYPLPKS